jgi:comEA protein
MFNLTRQERQAILFLVIILLFGLGINFISKNYPAQISAFNYDYQKVNLNTADLKKFVSVPGIGVKIAQGIIEYRKLHGKFNTLEELKQIKGIGEVKYDLIKDYFLID